MDWNNLLELIWKVEQLIFEKKMSKRKVDLALFTKKSNNDLLIMQIYMDDIIFGATKHYLYENFSKLM